MRRPNDFDGTTVEPSLLLRVRGFIEVVWFIMKVIGLVALEIYELLGFIALEFYHVLKQDCWQRRLYAGVLLLGVGYSFGSMVYTKPVITLEMVAAHNWWENGAEMPDDYYEASDRYIVAQEQADLVKVWFWRLREPYNTLGLEYQSKADNWYNEIAILERKRDEKKHLVRVYHKILARQEDQRVRNMGRMMRRALPFLFKSETLYDKIVTLSDDEKQDVILHFHLCFIFVCPVLYVFKFVSFITALKVQVFAGSIHFVAYISFGI